MNTSAVSGRSNENASSPMNLAFLMTRERWIEVARIVATGLIAFLFWQEMVPVQMLWLAVAVGLYPLVKPGCWT